jgi:hypothetical protein
MRICIMGLCLAVALTSTVRADDFKVEEGYKSLFNGKDLTGWRYSGMKGKPLDGKTETPDGRIEVKDGIIVVNEKDSAGKGGIKDLYTVEDFGTDFHLKLEFRASLKSDSGVYLRGPQLQVRDFIRRGEQKKLADVFKNDDWNELDITVKGKMATCLLNGKELEIMKNLPVKGGIGLQAETGKFEFRRVRVKVLD